jgi:hypothetical protein
MTALWSSTKIAFLAPVALAVDGSRVHSVKAQGGSFNNTRTSTPPRVPGTEGDDVTRCEGDDVFDNKFLVALESVSLERLNPVRTRHRSDNSRGVA